MVTGGIASIGEAFAVDLPFNITCPQVNACEALTGNIGSIEGVAVDGDGTIYTGTVSGFLLKVSPNGESTQFASGMGILSSAAVDADGNIYVGNASGELWKVTPTGVKTRIVTGLGGDAKGVAVTSDDSLVAVTNAGVLWKVTQGGVKTQITNFGSAGTWGLAVDGDGNAYVSNTAGVLKRVTPAGVTTQIVSGLGTAIGVALDGVGNIYVANGQGELWRVTPNGSRDLVASNFGVVGSGYRAYGVAFDANGNAYVASNQTGKLWRLPGAGAPFNQAPAAPSISAPKPNAETGAFPVFKGHALAENGSVDADEVQILDKNGIVLGMTPVRQSDGYFSWAQDGKWDAGPHEVRFVAVRGDLKSDATVLKFTVAPGPVAPVVTV
ncbi:hypothetical protein ACWGBU_40815, partial [Streptomyces vinaceus]